MTGEPMAARSDVDRLADLARRHGVRVAVAESLTSGMLAGRLGAGPGAADWLGGGVVAYQTEVKERVLGLAPGVDPCSPECAEQLAHGVRQLFAADVAVSTTGVGGPDPQDGHPPGTVYLGWSTPDETGHLLLRLEGDPPEVLEDAVAQAVRLLTVQVIASCGDRGNSEGLFIGA